MLEHPDREQPVTICLPQSAQPVIIGLACLEVQMPGCFANTPSPRSATPAAFLCLRLKYPRNAIEAPEPVRSRVSPIETLKGPILGALTTCWNGYGMEARGFEPRQLSHYMSVVYIIGRWVRSRQYPGPISPRDSSFEGRGTTTGSSGLSERGGR